MIDFSSYNFAAVMDYPKKMKMFNLSEEYDPEYIRSFEWGIGKYNEKRRGMYEAPQFESKPTCAKASKGKRNIHMGVDIWTEAGSRVYAFYDGTIAYFQDNAQPGDYGPTIVTKHILEERSFYALFGHLSRSSLEKITVGETIKKGQKIATIGSEEVNGGWAPHLHFQISMNDPHEADMPGVVADGERERALKVYPDPRIIMGELY